MSARAESVAFTVMASVAVVSMAVIGLGQLVALLNVLFIAALASAVLFAVAAGWLIGRRGSGGGSQLPPCSGPYAKAAAPCGPC